MGTTFCESDLQEEFTRISNRRSRHEECKTGSNRRIARFTKNPPNATVSVFGKDGLVKDAVVVLKNPKLEGDKLTFNVQTLEGDLNGGDGAAAVFIDIIGRPFTPMPASHVARRFAVRCMPAPLERLHMERLHTLHLTAARLAAITPIRLATETKEAGRRELPPLSTG
jgi:hypothetical protein